MNRKPSLVVIVALLVVNACGPMVGASDDEMNEPGNLAATFNVIGEEPSNDSLGTDPSMTQPVATSTVVTNEGSISSAAELNEPAVSSGSKETPLDMPASPTPPSTSTTAVVANDPETTTTQPPADVDLDEMTEALRELDALLGLFDGQVDSVDLDETEGESP